ncbi:hypothetical protein TSUD_111690 [Trifolium subterraneum]|uniref:Uncharacterized protein n=1 Tax=Trifolium subterraneum TaxID=3900 RepID=A0A2Z6N7L6_TRISU|nr:hypothetical protein TSUD_111690 [Trifolium subterraneum]
MTEANNKNQGKTKQYQNNKESAPTRQKHDFYPTRNQFKSMVEAGTGIEAIVCSYSCATRTTAMNTTTAVKTTRRENYSDEDCNGDGDNDTCLDQY